MSSSYDNCSAATVCHGGISPDRSVSTHEPRLTMGPQTSPTLVYVCSAARSGSTLTDMYLGGHSRVASLGELNFVGKAIRLGQDCTCGSKVKDCAAWNQVYDAWRARHGLDLRLDPYGLRLWDAMASKIVDHEHQTPARRLAVKWRKIQLDARNRLPGMLRHWMPLPSQLRQAVHNKIDLVHTIAAVWDKPVLIDSSKNFREAVELYQAWPEGVKIILLSRDGRGVFLSQRKGGRDRAHSIKGWLKYYRHALPLLEKRVAATAIHRLYYEDLARDPESVGRALCAFIGIEFEPDMLELDKGVRHMVNGNNTRFAPLRGIRLDERWREELVGADLDYFNHHAASMNRRLGYE